MIRLPCKIRPIPKHPEGCRIAPAREMGQTHVQRYLGPLLEKIESGQIDPSFIITHRLPLEDAPAAYKVFKDKDDECIKVVLKP